MLHHYTILLDMFGNHIFVFPLLALSSSIRNFSVGVDEKEKNAHFPPLACARIKQENQVHSHINSGKRFDAGKEAECHYQLPPELALPPEWTY